MNSEVSKRSRMSAATWMAVFVSITAMVVNIIWLLIDQQPHPVVDPYIEAIWNLTRGYTEKEIWEYPRLVLWSGLAPRVPFYQVISSPFVMLLGFNVDSILMVNSIFVLVLGVTTYRIADRIMKPYFSVIAVILVVTFPVVTELSRLVRPHALVPALVALVLLQCLRTIEDFSVKNAWLLALVVFISFCNHASSLYLVWIPVVSVFVCAWCILSPSKLSVLQRVGVLYVQPIFRRGLLPAFSLVAFLIGTWMVVQWDFYVGMQKVIEDIFIPMARQWQLEERVFSNLGIMNAALLLVAIVIILMERVRADKSSLTILLGIWLFAMFLSFHLFLKAGYWHMFSGSVSLIAVLSAKGLEYLCANKSPALKAGIVAIVLLAVVQSYAATAWGVFSVKGLPCGSKNPVCEGGLTDLRSNRPQSAHWPIEQLLSPLFSGNNCDGDSICSVTLVSYRSQYFSHELFQHTLANTFDQLSRSNSHAFYPGRNVTVSRVGEHGTGKLNWLHSDYVIYLLNSRRQPFASKLSDYGTGQLEIPIVDFIDSQVSLTGGLFTKLVEVRLPNGFYAILTKRIKTDTLVVNVLDEVLGKMNISDAQRRQLLSAK